MQLILLCSSLQNQHSPLLFDYAQITHASSSHICSLLLFTVCTTHSHVRSLHCCFIFPTPFRVLCNSLPRVLCYTISAILLSKCVSTIYSCQFFQHRGLALADVDFFTSLFAGAGPYSHQTNKDRPVLTRLL